jgi:hypothetical protein
MAHEIKVRFEEIKLKIIIHVFCRSNLKLVKLKRYEKLITLVSLQIHR